MPFNDPVHESVAQGFTALKPWPETESWGPVRTKEEAELVLHTSLRCKRGASGQLVFREWCPDIVEEHRVFWNHRVVAVSFAGPLPDDDAASLLAMVHDLPIPYGRCVLDVALLRDGSWRMVEINSWAVNSGGMRFNWTDDDFILYPAEGSDLVVLRGDGAQDLVHYPTGRRSDVPIGLSPAEIARLIPLAPTGPACWLLTERYLYVCNDVFLGQFDRATFRSVHWASGDFRWTSFVVVSENPLQFSLGDRVFHHDLTVLRRRRTAPGPPPRGADRYGFAATLDGRSVFCRLTYTGTFTIVPF